MAKKVTIIAPENLRSENYMKELFGLGTKQLRELARREHWNVAEVTRQTRLYDVTDAVTMFENHKLNFDL